MSTNDASATASEQMHQRVVKIAENLQTLSWQTERTWRDLDDLTHRYPNDPDLALSVADADTAHRLVKYTLALLFEG